MAQSKLRSWKEAITNVVVGYLINYVANLLIFNGLFHQHLTWEQNMYAGVIFTIISLIRGYLIRRWMNAGD
jgi:hypothetical protein